MTTPGKNVWVFRIVHQDTGKPAQGVPVTVLDGAGNPAGYWVSEADGTVTVPRRDGPRLRLRVGLRNEEPIELVTARLAEGPTDLAAPSWVPLATATPERVMAAAAFAERAPAAPAGRRDAAADFFALARDQPAALRYGVLLEVEELWQSLGVQWGELLYSVSLTPGDEARLAVLDGLWRREVEGRERPLQILARMVGTSMLGDLVTALRPELQLEPYTLSDPDLHAAAAESVELIRERTERMSHALRRRPLGVVDAHSEAPNSAAVRTVRNTTHDRVVTFHFFEPLERFRVMVRSPRVRPVVFVPFRLPNVATPDVVRRFGYIFRRTLLDRGLLPDLERLVGGDGEAGRGGDRLLEHIESNLLYYSTAIISAGDPAARHVALSKLRAPSGVPLTDVVENSVLGRLGNAIALPLRTPDLLPAEWRDAVAAYTARPLRVSEDFSVTIPHPGVWVTAQPHEPMQQSAAESAAG